MLEARKENKVYKINDTVKQRYLNDGFDIYDENGKIVEHTPLKKIKYSDHLKALEAKEKEVKALEEKLAVKDKAANVVELLKGYAEQTGVDIGSSTSAKGILDKILEVEKV